MTTLALLECGSNSLKVHYLSESSGEIESIRFPWRLGHEVFQTGSISQETISRALSTVEELVRNGFDRRSLLAIATEGIRDAGDQARLLSELRDRSDLEVRVISGREEASLLAEGYARQHRKIPAFLVDIGGGSLQLVNISAEKTVLRDSLPLGAIRLHYLGADEGGVWNRTFVEDYIESNLEEACLMHVSEVYATGGTLKAVSKVLGKTAFYREEISSLLERVTKEGPPEILSPARQEIFLPGLLVLARLLDELQATSLHYLKIRVGRILLRRLLDRLGPAARGGRKALLLNDMRITNIRPML